MDQVAINRELVSNIQWLKQKSTLVRWGYPEKKGQIEEQGFRLKIHGKACLKRRSLDILTPPPHTGKRRKLPRHWLTRSFRYTYLKLLRLRGKPKVLAKGLALGVFAGCFPFFGIQSLLGLFLATVCRGSKVTALAATWISNPLTYVPLFVFNYKIGKLLLGTKDAQLPPLDIESFTAFKELGSTFAITLLTGSFVVGMILSVITYFYGLAILEKIHDRSVSRRRLKKRK